MTIRDLQISFPPSADQQVDVVKLTGERFDREKWQSFSATVTIDWSEIAEYLAKGGRKVLANKAITVDSRIFEPKEVQND